MYCPNCGSQNQDELKFCTRCGANLGMVSEALSGKVADKPWTDDPMVEMLKNYYDGRRSTGIGVGSIIIGLAMLAILFKLNVPENLTGVLMNGVAACALIYGAIAIIYGLAGWVESSSKMKAINHPALQKSLPDAAQELRMSPSKEYVTAPTSESFPEPVASVTEQTTRELQERLSEGEIKRA